MLSVPNSGPHANARDVALACPVAGIQYSITVFEIDKAKSAKWIKVLTDFGLANVDIDITIMNADFNMPHFKLALGEAGFSWIYHGSKYYGHEHVPSDFKGAILLRTKAAAAKSTIGDILTKLKVNHVFHDKVHVHSLYFHPLIVPTLLQQLGVEWEAVLAWREANLTTEHLSFSPKRKSNSNPETGNNSSSETNTEERHVHVASRVEPQASRGPEVSALLERLHALDAKVALLQGAAASSNTADAGSSNSAVAAVVVDPKPVVPAPPVSLSRAVSSKRPRD